MRGTLAACVVVLLAAIPAGAGQWWIPAAAHAEGAAGSVWRTDLVVHNFGSTFETVTVTLLRQGQDNSALSTLAALSVPAGATVVAADAVQGLFGEQGNAALKVDATGDQLLVTSRTYNQTDDGTYGQAIPGVTTESALGAGQASTLLGLSGTDGRRTNLGWVNLESTEVTVTVELYRASGELLTSAQFAHQPPYVQRQLNEVFSSLQVAPEESAYARVTASGRIHPYASVVAALSSDPVYVAARSSLDLGTELLYPAVVHAGGTGGTAWRTDAWLFNAGSEETNVILELLLQNQANPSPTQREVTLASGEQRELDDLVLATFGLDNAQGALRVRADQPLLATSRTYTTAAVGTYGQSIPAASLVSLPGRGEAAYLAGATQNGTFRSNLGLVTTSAGSRVDLVLRGADGSVLATTSRELGQNQQVQLNNLSALFGTGDFSGATVEATLAAAADDDAVFAAYLSVVDGASYDPTYIPAARGLGQDPELEQVDETVIAATYALGKALDYTGAQSRPKVTGATKDDECITVAYSGDTLLPGQSPDGKCWQAEIAFAGCTYTFPTINWSFSQQGSASADICIIDGYPSTLAADLTTTLDDGNTGEHYAYSLDATLRLVLAFAATTSRPESAWLQGYVALDVNGSQVDGWVDLEWEANATGYGLIPVGVMGLHFPYPTETGMTTAEVAATFDGSEWVYVQVRLGYWQTHFCVNLYTGAVVYC